MYEPNHSTESGGGFIMGLLCGAALGAAVGLIFAPKAGADLRRTLADSTSDFRKKAYEAYEQATMEATDMMTKGADLMAKGKDGVARGKQVLNSVREAVAD